MTEGNSHKYAAVQMIWGFGIHIDLNRAGFLHFQNIEDKTEGELSSKTCKGQGGEILMANGVIEGL